MLSILIPVFNNEFAPLVKKLVDQMENKIPFEIILMDDASIDVTIHNHHEDFPKEVKVIFQKTNVGRSNIRNLLCKEAKFDWCLFIDADTLPVYPDFIEKYMDYIKVNPTEKVIFGGLRYQLSDKNATNHLRFKYGMLRECKMVNERMKKPYASMLMSNTVIHKNIFKKVQFNPSIVKYGHEDAVFGYDLLKQNIDTVHIENPVYHTGVEDNRIFLAKTRIALENLKELYELGVINPKVNKLLRYYTYLGHARLVYFFKKLYEKNHEKWEKKLHRDNPSILLFDLYRLSYFCTL